MIWICGVAGFIGGFLMGQLILSNMLSGYSRQEILDLLKNDPGRKLRYGLMNWTLAAAGTVAGMELYRLWEG